MRARLPFISLKKPKRYGQKRKRVWKSFFLGFKKSVFCFAFPCVSFFSRLALFWLTVFLFSAFMFPKVWYA
jgi:hypothetical protein